MNKKTSWIVAIIWMATLFLWFRSHPQKPAFNKPADQAFSSIQLQEKAAGNDKDKLADVITQYNSIATSYKDSEYASKARLEIGIIQDEHNFMDKKTLLGGGGPSAVMTYASVAKTYHDSPIGLEAGRRLYELEKKLDEQNKTTLMRRSYPGAVSAYGVLVNKYSDTEIGKNSETWMNDLEKRLDVRNKSNFLYRILDSIVNLTGRKPAYSYALALLIITMVFKLVTTPLSVLQFKGMRDMQRIQPLIKEVQTKYKDDQKLMGEKVMQIYKDNGVNPFASCLPVLVQMPVLIFLYKMVRLYQYQFSFGKFLWIGSSLSVAYPKFIGTNLAHADTVLLVLYTVSMFISQKLTPVDPSQAEQQKMMTYTMPIMFGVMFYVYAFPSAFMLYWLFFNVVSTLHQYFVLRKPAVPATAALSIEGSGGAVSENPTEVTKKIASASPGKGNRRKKR